MAFESDGMIGVVVTLGECDSASFFDYLSVQRT